MKNKILPVLSILALVSSQALTTPAKADWVVSYTAPIFYQDLSPHGSWFIVEPYGWVWQPSVVSFSAGWRPYCHGGAWFWTDCGWYWESSYNWGWIPFHFGWWVLDPYRGWVWVPGSYWAPAWVCWRTAPGYYGWAPLPPPALPGAYLGFGFDSGDLYFGGSVSLTAAHYVFVDEDDICEPAVETRTAPASETQNHYADSAPRRDFSALREKATAILANRPAVAATPQAQAFLQRKANKPVARALASRPPGPAVSDLIGSRGSLIAPDAAPLPRALKSTARSAVAAGLKSIEAPNRALQLASRPTGYATRTTASAHGTGAMPAQRPPVAAAAAAAEARAIQFGLRSGAFGENAPPNGRMR